MPYLTKHDLQFVLLDVVYCTQKESLQFSDHNTELCVLLTEPN